MKDEYKHNEEIRDLTIEELDEVSGGMSFRLAVGIIWSKLEGALGVPPGGGYDGGGFVAGVRG